MIETSLLEDHLEASVIEWEQITVVDRKWYVCCSQYHIIPCTANNSNQEIEIIADLQQFHWVELTKSDWCTIKKRRRKPNQIDVAT